MRFQTSLKFNLRHFTIDLSLEDEKIQQNIEIPNENTLKVFAEDKSRMQVFHTIDELRKDLLIWNVSIPKLAQ